MSINISDPLSLLPYQSGLADPVLIEAAANAANDLTAPQQAYKIGDPVPIVFCRRVSGNGGVMISPGATEGRYENDGTTNELTVSLHLVLSEGDLPTIPIKDVFVGPCRQGTWNQNYDRRSGTWIPGNFITVVTGKIPWTCPFYCGTSGRYEDMTTLSYVNSFPDGSQRWQQQVHVFVREGIKVTRIIDSTLGPSNNVIDLAIYLMNESGIIDSTLIDNTQMLAGANFCQTNGLFFNGVFKQSLNLDDWLAQIGNDFLLRLVETNGKIGYKPRLPVNADHTIKTTAIDWVFTFTEDHLLPDGFEIEYISLEDRQPVCLQMMWRQQPETDIGFPRTTEIRFSNEAPNGPFVQYDLSQFCTSETHAVKVGAYRLARRKYITHTLRLNVRPASYNSTLALGDIVRVRLRRETATTALDYHDFLYEVERIEKTASGACVLDLTHFPIDSQGRSLVALEVDAATAVGADIEIGRSDYTCDENSATSTTGLGSAGLDYSELEASADFDPPALEDLEVDLPGPSNQPGETLEETWPLGGSSPIGPDFASPGGANPSDPLEEVDETGISDITGATGLNGAPQVGDTLAVSESDLGCVGEVTWYRVDKNTGERTVISRQTQPISGNYFLSVTSSELDYYIQAEGRCADPSTPSGYGSPRTLGTTDPVIDSSFPIQIGGTHTNLERIEISFTYRASFPPVYRCDNDQLYDVGVRFADYQSWTIGSPTGYATIFYGRGVRVTYLARNEAHTQSICGSGNPNLSSKLFASFEILDLAGTTPQGNPDYNSIVPGWSTQGWLQITSNAGTYPGTVYSNISGARSYYVDKIKIGGQEQVLPAGVGKPSNWGLNFTYFYINGYVSESDSSTIEQYMA